MHTGRTLTVFRWRTPPRKIGDTPRKNLAGTTWKIGDPQKIGGPPRKIGGTPSGTRPPPVNRMNDRRMWKYYLGQNFVSAGKKCLLSASNTSKYLVFYSERCSYLPLCTDCAIDLYTLLFLYHCNFTMHRQIRTNFYYLHSRHTMLVLFERNLEFAYKSLNYR